MSKYGILGYGIVGKATHVTFLKNENPIIVDKGDSLEELLKCEYVFICLPSNDKNDLVEIFKYSKALKTVIIRSTVPVNFCRGLKKDNLIYIPEFLRETSWRTDCKKSPYIIASNIGIPSFIKVKYKEMTFEEAEITKLMSNAYNSLRIVFANHMYDLAKETKSDYDNILKAHNAVKHNDSYLHCHEYLRGFGGKCLPKDLDHLIKNMKELNLAETLLTSIKNDNAKWKTTIF